MAEQKKTTDKQPLSCPGCGGSGQTSYFGGASRFMLTWEDCPDCCGTGIVLDEKNSDMKTHGNTGKKCDDAGD